MANCLKRAETDIVLSVLDVCAYIGSFSASLDMNQVPEKTISWSKSLAICDEKSCYVYNP